MISEEGFSRHRLIENIPTIDSKPVTEAAVSINAVPSSLKFLYVPIAITDELVSATTTQRIHRLLDWLARISIMNLEAFRIVQMPILTRPTAHDTNVWNLSNYTLCLSEFPCGSEKHGIIWGDYKCIGLWFVQKHPLQFGKGVLIGKVRTNRWTDKWNMHIAGLSRFDTLSSEYSYFESNISPRSNLEVIILDSIGKYHVSLLSKKKSSSTHLWLRECRVVMRYSAGKCGAESFFPRILGLSSKAAVIVER